MKFNSQICTDKNQSERLLALGLKPETSDCYLFEYEEGKYKVITESWLDLIADGEYYLQYKDVCIPAWSLHRLNEMMPKSIHFENEDWYKIIYNNSVCYQRGQFSICRSCKGDLYEDIANCIKRLIKEGYFKKEYLV